MKEIASNTVQTSGSPSFHYHYVKTLRVLRFTLDMVWAVRYSTMEGHPEKELNISS